MSNIVIASTRKSAGKTSLIMGMAKATQRNVGYIKPFGDRLLYRKKRLWDYDAALLANVLGMGDSAEGATLGFERSKLKYMYNEESTRERLLELGARAGEGREHLIVEAGQDFSLGVSVYLDPLSLARTFKASLVVVVRGSEDTVIDDVALVKRYLDGQSYPLTGVVVNGVQSVDDFKDTYLPELTALQVNVLGVLPLLSELRSLRVQSLAETLFARVIAGDSGMHNELKNIFVGAMSADAAMRNPLFKKEKKLIITSGDRSDMILAALEDENTSAVVLANNILPPSNVTNLAAQKEKPLLLVSMDTFQAARQIYDMEPLLTREDNSKMALLGEVVKANLDLSFLD